MPKILKVKDVFKIITRHKYIFLGLIIFLTVSVSGFYLMKKLDLLYPNNRLNLSEDSISSLVEKVYILCTASPREQDRSQCLREQVGIFTSKYGLVTAEVILGSLISKKDLVKGCHVLAHEIGYAAYKKNPKGFWVGLKIANSDTCGAGTPHGLVESYLVDHPEVELNNEFIEKVCLNDDPYKQGSCTHLVGHLFLIETLGDLEQALPLCKTIDKRFRFNCYDGLFMEHHQRFMLSQHAILPPPKYTKEYIERLEENCLSYTDDVIARVCWRQMAEVYDHAYGYIPQKIFDECAKAPKEEFARLCYSKGIIIMSVSPLFNTPEKILSLCSFYKPTSKDYDSCVNYIITANLYNSPKLTKEVTEVCLITEDNYTKRCFEILNTKLKVVIKDKSKRKQYCEMIPAAYSENCLN